MFLLSFRLGWSRGIPIVALLAVATLIHPIANGQAAPGRPERADPLDPQVRVPAVTHTSPLARYRRLGDDKRVPWTEANETVNRIGGWRAYAREALQPDPAASAPAARATVAPNAAPSAAPGHGGHKTH
jgi:hypothetical protein